MVGGSTTYCPADADNSSCPITSRERGASYSSGAKEPLTKTTTTTTASLISDPWLDSGFPSSVASLPLSLYEPRLHLLLCISIPSLLHEAHLLEEHHQHPLASPPPTALLLAPPLLLPPHLQHLPHHHPPFVLLLLLLGSCIDTGPTGRGDECGQDTSLAVAGHQLCSLGGRLIHPSQVRQNSKRR